MLEMLGGSSAGLALEPGLGPETYINKPAQAWFRAPLVTSDTDHALIRWLVSNYFVRQRGALWHRRPFSVRLASKVTGKRVLFRKHRKLLDSIQTMR